MVARVKEQGMEAIALTDHGNLFGALDFFEHAKQEQIKPIIGCELYLAEGSRFDRNSSSHDKHRKYHHLILLCQNQTGYKNLIKLSSIGYLEGFYYKPQIDKEVLAEYNEGLIALSACIKGEIPSLLISGREEAARKALEEYLSIFGNDRFLIELQRHGLPEEKEANGGLIKLAQDYDLRLVATNDAHYLRKEDYKAHEILLCVGSQKTINEDHLTYHGDQFYLKSEAEMRDLFTDIPEAIDNTQWVADQCTFEYTFDKFYLPNVAIPKAYTYQEYLEKITWDALPNIYPEGYSHATQADIKERLEFELAVINQMKLAEYFLCVLDIISWSRNQGILVGPGRGSAAGCMVSYLIGITTVDPIPFNLLFERFLNPDRIGLPDIDTDFQDDRRGEVIQYIRETYGDDKVAMIITFGSLKARAVIRDVGRVLEIPLSEVDRIAKMIPGGPKASLNSAWEDVPDLRELIASKPQYEELWNYAQKLEGVRRHASTHAAGILIGNEPLDKLVPLYRESKTGQISSQFEGQYLETAGLVKMDILGLRNLTTITNCLNLIRNQYGIEIDLETVGFDDPLTYAMLQRGEALGVFQLEGSGMRGLLRDLKPEVLEEIIALIALYRPGVLKSKMDREFVERKHGRVEVTYPHEDLQDVLKETYGIIVYQEQVMLISRLIAGFSRSEADHLRKAMGKKQKEKMVKFRQQFIKGAVANGYDKELAESIYDMMAQFAEYGFNKSHAAAYGYITYRTAYLKANFPVAYMTALLTNEVETTDKINIYLAECRTMGIEVLPPHINTSDVLFTIQKGKSTQTTERPIGSGDRIQYALAAIKNVGRKAMEDLVQERTENGPYKNLYDLCERLNPKSLNRRTLEYLIYAGALDGLGSTRNGMISVLDEALKYGQQGQNERNTSQLSLFDATTATTDELTPTIPHVPEYDQRTCLSYEKSALGFFFSDHPYHEILEAVKKRGLALLDLSELESIKKDTIGVFCAVLHEFQIVKNAKGKLWSRLRIGNLQVEVEALLFANQFERFKSLMVEEHTYLFLATVSEPENRKLIIDELFTHDDDSITKGNIANRIKQVKQRNRFMGSKEGKIMNQPRMQDARAVSKTTSESSKPISTTSLQGFHICLVEDEMIQGTLEEIRSLIDTHKGKHGVYFHLDGTGSTERVIRAGDQFCVDGTDSQFNKLLKKMSPVKDAYLVN